MITVAISLKDKEFLRSHSAEKTAKEWAEYFNQIYTTKTIYSFCKRNDYPLRRRSDEEISKQQSQNVRKWHINEDYFKTWSHNMAYTFGLWFANGCIYGGKMFDITLHKNDKYVLKRIADELKYEGPIIDYVDRQAARLNFSCVVIYRDIVALGGSERKSLTCIFPDIPKEYLPDFIRGYFDGDGSVFDVDGKRLNSEFCSGSPDFLYQLWDVLKQEAGIEGGSYHSDKIYSNGDYCRELKFGKKDTLKLRDYMYQGNPELFMKRKKDHFYKFGN